MQRKKENRIRKNKIVVVKVRKNMNYYRRKPQFSVLSEILINLNTLDENGVSR